MQHLDSITRAGGVADEEEKVFHSARDGRGLPSLKERKRRRRMIGVTGYVRLQLDSLYMLNKYIADTTRPNRPIVLI